MLDMETQGTATRRLMLQWSHAIWCRACSWWTCPRARQQKFAIPSCVGCHGFFLLLLWSREGLQNTLLWRLSCSVGYGRSIRFIHGLGPHRSAVRRASKEDHYVCAHGRKKECSDLWRPHILAMAHDFVQQWHHNMCAAHGFCSTLTGCLNYRWCLQWRGTVAFLRTGWAVGMRICAVPIMYWSGWEAKFRCTQCIAFRFAFSARCTLRGALGSLKNVALASRSIDR